MNDVFERIVERTFREAAQNIGTVRGEGQATIPNVIDGPHAVSMRPDVLIKQNDGTPVLVADAKWKTRARSVGDVYQLTSYVLALETTGVLVYPNAKEIRGNESTVAGEH
jgi:5-methylcytosine-specific restriction enzyme subunit McrC